MAARWDTPAAPQPTPGNGAAGAGDDLGQERWELLRQIDALLDGPMVVLSFVWLGLTVLDLATGLGQTLTAVSYAIWALFALHFLLGVAIAPSITGYLRRNWLTALALVLPAFRLLRAVRAFRLLRAARAARSVSLLRLVTTLNRGMRAVNRVIGHRGIGYVLLLTLMVTSGGAAGMAQFESPAALGEPGSGLDGYWEALWWTAMTMTTMGPEYFPRTLEGRVLGWLLALYAFTVFGYITATIASLFLARDVAASTAGAGAVRETGQDRAPDGARLDPAGELAALRHDVAALRTQVAALAEVLARAPAGEGRESRGAAPALAPGGRVAARPDASAHADDPDGAAADRRDPVGRRG